MLAGILPPTWCGPFIGRLDPGFIMTFRTTLLAVAAGAALSAPANAAVTFVVDQNSGKLLGADDVLVGSDLYDVRFLDGTCAAIFGGCDQASDFALTDQAQAQAAAVALITQVFGDIPDPRSPGSQLLFNSDPSATNGCTQPLYCSIRIPYAHLFDDDVLVPGSGGGFFSGFVLETQTFVSAIEVRNTAPNFTGPLAQIVSNPVQSGTDLATSSSDCLPPSFGAPLIIVDGGLRCSQVLDPNTFARFTLSSEAVPAPGALGLLGLAALGLTTLRRRKA
ncbi:MAG: PEP-CTERM sorting domain-containing protein [Pacificimonas sp.]|jgi:hypothetical protein|nr:PEP-CTERM sorting domain-containing protein [Pacificimonas sp.]